MKKTIYATVMYKCNDFDIFINDYLFSVFYQTEQNFELLIVVDNVDITIVEGYIKEYNINNKIVHIKQYDELLSPIQLRKKLIDISYSLKADSLIFSDFDENVANNRIEEIEKKIDKYTFVFNDFYVVDSKLNKLDKNTFFKTRDIPNIISDWHDIQSFNFIGFGSLAINLSLYDYKSMDFPDDIKALDWFIATKVLLNRGKGFKLSTTYSNYRQHDSSFVGFNFELNTLKLKQGLDIKLTHYKYFQKYNIEFENLYYDLIELKNYISNIGEQVYINVVNNKFDTITFCWWENIKIKKEII